MCIRYTFSVLCIYTTDVQFCLYDIENLSHKMMVVVWVLSFASSLELDLWVSFKLSGYVFGGHPCSLHESYWKIQLTRSTEPREQGGAGFWIGPIENLQILYQLKLHFFSIKNPNHVVRIDLMIYSKFTTKSILNVWWYR